MKLSAFKRAFALLLALILIALSLAACGKRQGKTLLTLDSEGVKVTFSVNHYQLLLSRLRGNFVRQGVANSAGDASQAAFWDMQGYPDDTGALKTWDLFYREQVLKNCKTYLVALWVFEKNKLSLSDTARAEIEQELDDILAYQANGSKAKLNSILAEFGVNYDLLKAFYEIEAKTEAAMGFLYGENASLLDATVKDPYLNANYYRYKRILFPLYTTDGETVNPMSEEETAAVRARATALLADLQGKTEVEFEAAATEENGTDEYTDGYYLPRSASSGSDSDVAAILEKLSEAEEGETVIVELSDGIQIIRRYAPTPGAYDMSVNAVWFSSFAAGLMAELFAKNCESYADRITLDETVFAEAPKIKEIGPNYYF